MQLLTLIVLFATMAFNLIEGCPIKPPGYLDLRKPRRSMIMGMDSPALTKLRQDVVRAVDESYQMPAYGPYGHQDQPDLRADIMQLMNTVGQLMRG